MKIKKSTIILSALCAVFLTVNVVQCVLANMSPVEMLSVDGNADKITVSGPGADLVLNKKDGEWFIGATDFKALPSTAELMEKSLKEIKVLDTPAKTGDEVVEERYDLNAGKYVIASVYEGDKLLRSVKIGKQSATGTQSYISIDDNGKIYLVQGDFKSIFVKTDKEVISKKIYSAENDDIVSVSVKSGKDSWGFDKIPSEGPEEIWAGKGSMSGTEVNSEKVSQWAVSLSYLDAEDFIDDDAVLPANAEAEVSVETADDVFVVSIYAYQSGENEYAARCNKNAHPFAVSKYVAEKFLKKAADLK